MIDYPQSDLKQVPTTIAPFYYWLCENYDTSFANEMLKQYLLFEEASNED
jgi:hypothetical protein